ncbi:MAG: TlpA family protein disulfide reductase [Pseudomonadota bacterium]|nr:TlpA family protein disulfide reductase [Pseudomonadota bacterium]
MKSLAIRPMLIAATLVLVGCDRQSEAPPAENTGQPAKGLDRRHAGEAAPMIEIRDAQDEPASLAEASGKPLLVNIWATWCVPCVKELPTLDALSSQPGAPRVIAVSQDMAPRASVDAFLEQNKIADLEAWHDPEMTLSGALRAQVLPTTIYYDAQGRELWRFVGDLDWTGDEAARLLAEGPAGAQAS